MMMIPRKSSQRRKEGKMSGKQTEETDVPNEQMVFRVELRVFLGTHPRVDVYSKESQARISLYFSTLFDSTEDKTYTSTHTRIMIAFFSCGGCLKS